MACRRLPLGFGHDHPRGGSNAEEGDWPEAGQRGRSGAGQPGNAEAKTIGGCERSGAGPEEEDDETAEVGSGVRIKLDPLEPADTDEAKAVRGPTGPPGPLIVPCV